MWAKIVSFFMTVFIAITNWLGIDVKCIEPIVYYDLSYGTHERHKLDIAVPVNVGEETGLVLYIHGGGWVAGDKDSYLDAIKEVSKKHGVISASINYRYIGDDVDMFELLDDIDAAISFIKAAGLEQGIDIKNSILRGHSAGGHLSLLYSYSRGETSAIPPVAVISDAGPSDLRDDNYFYNADLGKDSALGSYDYIAQLLSWACGEPSLTYETRTDYADKIAAISPITYVTENTVPTVINHGKMDDVVPFSNAIALDEKLTEAGVEHYFNIYPTSDHGLGNDLSSARKTNELLGEYIKDYLK